MTEQMYKDRKDEEDKIAKNKEAFHKAVSELRNVLKKALKESSYTEKFIIGLLQIFVIPHMKLDFTNTNTIIGSAIYREMYDSILSLLPNESLRKIYGDENEEGK
jgi:hypothetical protein